MHFENDVFISYAHIDNQSYVAGSDGWVSEFHEALVKRLGEVLGKAPRVWRDPKLKGNDEFGNELAARFRSAATLVSVVTPRYIQSEWCDRELQGFWKAAGDSGGPVIGTKARVFKVIKTPVKTEPALTQTLLGYEFFRLQPGSGTPLEFNKVYGADAERDFWVRLNDLAYDLAELLKTLEAGANAAAARPAVYLAATTSELRPARDALRRQLLRHGWPVRPEAELPLVQDELEPAIAAHLADCAVSVHLLGSAWGVVPEGGTESLPALQARLAAERARSGGLARLVWIDPDRSVTDARQQATLAQLRDDPEPGPGSDLLETGLDALERQVVAQLEAVQAARAAAAAAAAQAAAGPPGQAGAAEPLRRVYLLCSRDDADAVLPLQRWLFDQGIEPLLPLFDADEADMRQTHEDNLRACDGLLIYYGAGGEAWMQRQLVQLRNLPTLNRPAALRASGICMAPPHSPAKQRLMTREAPMLPMGEGFTPAAMAPFLAALRAAR